MQAVRQMIEMTQPMTVMILFVSAARGEGSEF